MNKKEYLPCRNCICLAICKNEYKNELLDHLNRHCTFKAGALARARIKLANICSIFNLYLYDTGIDGAENLRREKTHHTYFICNDEILRREYPGT